ncbi:redoxin domain-containing protein [Chitinophaga deserti]|uniref:redoxin domain-containing protein n=1 Tax=Chitinophaga deserti TaxID=2164099 RepID=UPI000D6BEA0A|nr:redoxin domain-containing protein [Chitinophaga deserti]
MFTTNRYADLLPFRYDVINTRPKDRTPIQPVSEGSVLPLFHLHREDFLVPLSFLSPEGSYIVGSELLNQPLVLAFFSVHWNDYGPKFLQQLEDLYADIQVMGGQLLVVTGDRKEDLKGLQVKFPLAYDKDYRIAKSAGIYAETDPLWARLSGFEENAPLPAVYVLGQSQRIGWSFTDRLFDQQIPRRELLTAVYTTGQAQALSRAIA